MTTAAPIPIPIPIPTPIPTPTPIPFPFPIPIPIPFPIPIPIPIPFPIPIPAPTPHCIDCIAPGIEVRMAQRRDAKLEPLVPPALGRVRFDAGKTLWLWGMTVPGLLLGVPALTPTTTVVSLALAFVTLCLGHSVGLHRGIIHQSYRAHPITRGALAYLAVLSGLGGPLSWVRVHAVRDYWQSRADCPRYFAYDHSLAADFVWNLHLRFEPADPRAEAKLPRGVLADPWLRFLESTWPLHVAALAGVLALTLGPAAVASCVCARTAAGVVGHQLVTYAGHTWGEPRYVIPGAHESGRNVWLLGVLSFGEGFHNNHHRFPASARMGVRGHELDLGWCMLWLLERAHLVRDVVAWHRPPSRT